MATVSSYTLRMPWLSTFLIQALYSTLVELSLLYLPSNKTKKINHFINKIRNNFT